MITGKGMYLWTIRNCEGGDISTIVTKAKKAKLSHVIIKIADGATGFNYIDGIDKAKELADALKLEGIEPYGFQYVYGSNPYGEAMTANKRMRETGCVGFVIDAEKEYRDSPTNDMDAQTYVDALDFNYPIALATYRFPDLHPTLPYDRFLSACTFVMPQVYWQGADNSAEQLDECIKQYRKFTDLPILPTGAAYCEWGWCAEGSEIREFSNHAQELGLPGVNFWEWSNTVANGLWPAVRDLEWTEITNDIGDTTNCCDGIEDEINKLHDTVADEIEQVTIFITNNAAEIADIKDGFDSRLTLVEMYKDMIDRLNDRVGVLDSTVADNITYVENTMNARLDTIDETLVGENGVYERIEELEAMEIEENIEGLQWAMTKVLNRLTELENKTIPECNHSHRKLFSWLFNR